MDPLGSEGHGVRESYKGVFGFMAEEKKEIRTVWLDGSLRQEAAGLLLPEVAKALKKGLPAPVVCAVEGETIIGALTGAMNGGEFETASIFVHPDYRRRGAGRRMMEEIYSLLEDTDHSVSVEYSLFDNEQDTLRPFLNAMGFEESGDFYPAFFTSPLKDFEAKVRSAGGEQDDILQVDDVKERVLESAEGVNDSQLQIPRGTFTSKNTDRNSSFVLLKDDRITAYAAVGIMDNEVIRIDANGTEGPDSAAVLLLLSYAEQELKGKYKPDSTVCMLSSEPAAGRLIEKVMKDCARITYRFENHFPGVL